MTRGATIVLALALGGCSLVLSGEEHQQSAGGLCGGVPAISMEYLSGCSRRTWIVTDAADECFLGSTFELSSDGTEVHLDACILETMTDTFSVSGTQVTLHGYRHDATVLSDGGIRLALADNAFTIHRLCDDTPAVSVDYLTLCSQRTWTVTEATDECFVGSTFELFADGTELHYDACLSETRTDTFSVAGSDVTLHGYRHSAVLLAGGGIQLSLGRNTFTIE